MYKINDSRYENETFTISKVEELTNVAANLAQQLVEHNKEPRIYHLDRVIAGTRKKAYSVQCYRHNSGTFIAIL